MTALPLVSVIIPAHNAASDLPRAVASVLDQTVSSLEVVIVDDASSDATAEVAERLAAADPRVVLHRAPRNLGPAGARNLGIEAARGTWLALLDSDDAYLPGRLEALLELAEHTGAEMLADNLLFAGGPAGGPATVMLPPDLLRAPRQVGAAGFLIGNLPDRRHPRVSYGFLKPLFRREFLVQHGIRYDGRLRFAEDFDLYLRCLVAGARFWLTPEAGYLYTIREGSLTDTHTARDLLRLRAGRSATDAGTQGRRRPPAARGAATAPALDRPARDLAAVHGCTEGAGLASSRAHRPAELLQRLRRRERAHPRRAQATRPPPAACGRHPPASALSISDNDA